MHGSKKISPWGLSLIFLAHLSIMGPVFGVDEKGGVRPEALEARVQKIIAKSKALGIRDYPIGFWNYATLAKTPVTFNEAEIASWTDAGFTVVQSPEFNAAAPKQVQEMGSILDLAEKYGIKVLLRDSRAWAFPVGESVEEVSAYKEKLNAILRDFGTKPAFLGLCLGDEPEAKAKDALFSASRTFKQIAPQKVAFSNYLPWWKPTENEDCVKVVGSTSWPGFLDEIATKATPDFYSYDMYHQMKPGKGGWDNYFENLTLWREGALRNGIPFWNTLLCAGHFLYRVPNIDELRWQFMTTVAAGAHGVLWFHYYEKDFEINYRQLPVNWIGERTQTYKDLRLIQRQFQKTYGDLFTRIVCLKHSFIGEKYGFTNVSLFTGNIFVDSITTDPENHPLMVSEFVDALNRPYIMVVNNSMTESTWMTITFKAGVVQLTSFRDGAETDFAVGAVRRLSDSPLAIQHVLAPGQEVIWRITPPRNDDPKE